MSNEMELNKLRRKLNDIKKNSDRESMHLMREYAMKNAKFNVGDTLKGQTFTIIVSDIKWQKSQSMLSSDINPMAVYHGKILTKKLLPRKDGETALISDNEDGLIKLESKEQ